MKETDFTIAFHIGAHKTATTHLQASLRRSSGQLSEAGVEYYGPGYFRRPGRTIPSLFGLNAAIDPIRKQKSPKDQLHVMRKGSRRLILSEENFIGVLNSPRRFPIKQRYPYADGRISDLIARLEKKVDIFLGIRNPVTFLNSAYCQLLMSGRVMPVARFQELNPLESVDWLNLVKRIRALPGVDMLVVWRYEDYCSVFSSICAHLIGDERQIIVRPIKRVVHPSLSSPAVEEILRRHSSQQVKSPSLSTGKLFPVEEGHPPFDGFSRDVHHTIDEVYRSQVISIAVTPGVTLLTPESHHGSKR